jgi:2,3-bisphosphoglycerate-independent phosphoglycerate mutase
MKVVYGLKAAAIAAYPMYRGVAKLLGMETLQTGDSLAEEFQAVEKNWDSFDYFYVHVKRIDSSGEDGDFDRKVGLIEEVDNHLPRLLDLQPDVLIVTGDHSTPSRLKYHSWHPVPVLVWAEHCRADNVRKFGEMAGLMGGLGPRLPAKELMPLALANAMRLDKFGA